MACSKCKKPKNYTPPKLDEAAIQELTVPHKIKFDLIEEYWSPERREISEAYAELISVMGVKEEKKEFISKVYKFLFKEDFDWGCKSCSIKQARKWGNWMKTL